MRGLELLQQSWSVLRRDKELLVFPVLSGIACLIVLASFAVPLWLGGYPEALSEDPEPFREPLNWLILFAFYFVNYFVIVFFNSALVACAVIRFRGGDPTLADGFRAAGNRLPQIAKKMNCSVERINQAIERLSKLDTSPGLVAGRTDNHPISADIIVEPDEHGGYTVKLADAFMPSLRVNSFYKKMAQNRAIDEKTRELLALKQRLGYDDPRLRCAQCPVCGPGLLIQQEGDYIPEPYAFRRDVGTSCGPCAGNGQMQEGVPDFSDLENLVQRITHEICRELNIQV